MPVAAVTASASAITEAASLKSPLQVTTMPLPCSAVASCASAPASRASCNCRVMTASQLSTSQSAAAAVAAIAPNWSTLSSSRNALTAFRSVGAAGPSPSATSCARPSSRRSDASGSCAGGGAERTARETSRERAERPQARPQPQRRPTPRDRSRARGRCRAARAAWLPEAAAQRRSRSSRPTAIRPRKQIDACALKLVQGPRFGRGQHRERRVERAGLEARLCRRQRALGAQRRVGGQRNGALQKRGSRRRSRRELEPGRPIAPAREQPPRLVRVPHAPDARRGDQDRAAASMASASARCTFRRLSADAAR